MRYRCMHFCTTHSANLAAAAVARSTHPSHRCKLLTRLPRLLLLHISNYMQVSRKCSNTTPFARCKRRWRGTSNPHATTQSAGTTPHTLTRVSPQPSSQGCGSCLDKKTRRCHQRTACRRLCLTKVQPVLAASTALEGIGAHRAPVVPVWKDRVACVTKVDEAGSVSPKAASACCN
jgi:hypothetical protein